MTQLPILPSETPAPTGGQRRFTQAHLILLYFLAGALVIWLLSGFYQVRMDQIAIVERLGEYISTPDGKAIPVERGLHWHLPWPIDRVHVISTQERLTLPVKAFNASPAEYDEFKRTYLKDPDNPFGANPQALNAIFNPYLISADKSLLHMEVTVQFRVVDPEKWLMSVSHDYHTEYDPAATGDLRNALFQQIAQRALVLQAARLTFDQLLLDRRESLPSSMQNFVQEGTVLETSDPRDPLKKEIIDLGIQVLRVEVTVVRPPDAVKPFFENVLAQRLGRDTARSAAESDAQTMVTRAMGEAQTLDIDAKSYRTTTLRAAQGEAQRFSDVLTQYNNAPDVTRWNLYVDAATSVTSSAERIIFAQPGQRTIIEVPPAEPRIKP